MLLIKKFKVQIPLSIIELLKKKKPSIWCLCGLNYIYIYFLIGKLHTHQMSLELIILSSIEHLQGKDVWFEQEYIRGLQYSPNLICIHWLLYHDLHSKSFVVKCNT